MSLSRSVKFPLLKLPWLCVKCFLHNLDELVIIYFATISNRTRRIVRSSNYPLKEIDVSLDECSRISINNQLGHNDKEKFWYFIHDTYEYDNEFVLQIKSQPFRTSRYFDSWRRHCLRTSTAGDKVDALKMGIEFMIDVFGCTIRKVIVDGDKILELIGLGVSSVKELFISEVKPVIITDLKYLLESIKVTDEYVFCAHIPANFSCDPQIFKCRLLLFAGYHSAGWVTLELLCQFDVPQLTFWFHRFSVEDIVSYITHWFNSENRKLEYVQFQFRNLISLEGFEIAHLSPMPFCEKRRSKCPLAGKWKYTDISSGMDILRKDGLLATFFVKSTSAFFYIWHKRFPDAV
ncbi:unnamed protein product [Caenorhabditis brenneri]